MSTHPPTGAPAAASPDDREQQVAAKVAAMVSGASRTDRVEGLAALLDLMNGGRP